MRQSTICFLLAVLNGTFWMLNMHYHNDGVAVFNLIVACFCMFVGQTLRQQEQ